MRSQKNVGAMFFSTTKPIYIIIIHCTDFFFQHTYYDILPVYIHLYIYCNDMLFVQEYK